MFLITRSCQINISSFPCTHKALANKLGGTGRVEWFRIILNYKFITSSKTASRLSCRVLENYEFTVITVFFVALSLLLLLLVAGCPIRYNNIMWCAYLSAKRCCSPLSHRGLFRSNFNLLLCRCPEPLSCLPAISPRAAQCSPYPPTFRPGRVFSLWLWHKIE